MLEGLLGRCGMTGAQHGDRGPGSSRPGRSPWYKPSWRSPLTLPQSLRPNNYQGGSDTPPISRLLDKALLSKALPTRARPSFSHYQSLPSGSLYRLLSLLHQRADRRSKKHSPTATKMKTTLQKINHDEKEKVMSQI